MNRTLLLIAIAAIAIVGIGVGLLLPSLQAGPLSGSIVPMTTIPRLTIKLTPTPVPPVVITVTGATRCTRSGTTTWGRMTGTGTSTA